MRTKDYIELECLTFAMFFVDFLIMDPILVILGGAGNRIRNIEDREKYLGEALEAGYVELKEGEEALNAVIKAVVEMEDAPCFNAGTGSYTNLEGEVEMDASIMRSDGLFGAVAAIKEVKNPIKVARTVAEETETLLLVGEGATRFARLVGHRKYNPLTDEMKELYKKREESSVYKDLDRMRRLYSLETVGAVALDRFGGMAAAVSTGGIMFHLPGRVGDTPIIGGGIYAGELGAVAATGHGEEIMRNMVAKEAYDYLYEHNAEYAAEKVIKDIDADFGIIIIDRNGKVGIAYNTKYMSWGIKSGKYKKVQAT